MCTPEKEQSGGEEVETEEILSVNIACDDNIGFIFHLTECALSQPELASR